MHPPTPQPKLLVFTLGPEAESRRRRLVPEALRSAEIDLRRQCLERILEAGRQAGYRLEISSPIDPETRRDRLRHVPQREGSFGVRLRRALDDSLRDGSGPVVVVGTDVPDLSAGHLARALDALGNDPDRVVVGPSPDGGFYLLATHRPIEGLDSAVSWCCAATLRTLLDTLAAAGRPVVLLEPLTDLDGPADLERWLARSRRSSRSPLGRRWRTVLTPILRLLALRRRPWADDDTPRLFPGFLAPVPARGPPAHPFAV